MFWFRDENSKIEYRWDFQCRACSFKSSKKSEVLKHVESKHGIVHKKNPTSYKEIFDKISGNFQKCPSCLQYFNTEELMKKHIESSHTVIDRCFTLCSIFPKQNTKLPKAQLADVVFYKILGTINKTYPGIISMLQGFQKCIA